MFYIKQLNVQRARSQGYVSVCVLIFITKYSVDLIDDRFEPSNGGTTAYDDPILVIYNLNISVFLISNIKFFIQKFNKFKYSST